MQSFDDYRSFEAKVTVHRIEDKGCFVASIAIRCAETGEVMEFADPSIPRGASISRAMLNWPDTELSIPIRPPTIDRGSLPEDEHWRGLCTGTEEPDDALGEPQ